MSLLNTLKLSTSINALKLTPRLIHTTPPTYYPYKATQDRTSISADRGEETQSGRTSDVATRSDAAFNPQRTNPRSEKDAAATNGNPLEVSGANPDVSAPQGAEKEVSAKGGAGEEVSKGGKASGSKGTLGR